MCFISFSASIWKCIWNSLSRFNIYYIYDEGMRETDLFATEITTQLIKKKKIPIAVIDSIYYTIENTYIVKTESNE